MEVAAAGGLKGPPALSPIIHKHCEVLDLSDKYSDLQQEAIAHGMLATWEQVHLERYIENAKKVAKFALRKPGGHDFTPFVVESCGRQCSATHTPLNPLGRLAADIRRVTKGRGSRARCGD